MAKKKREIEKYSLLWWVQIINGGIQAPEHEILDNINTYDKFMINRFFSNVEELLQLANMSNKEGFSRLMHFKMIRSAYRAKMSYNSDDCRPKYTSKEIWQLLSSKLLKKNPDISMITDYFNVNIEVAQKYLKLISKEELQEIRDYYKMIESFNKITKTKLSKKDME